jgi:hypothetical protein
MHLHRKGLIVRRPAQSRAVGRTRVVVVLCVVALAILAGAILFAQMRGSNPSPAQPSLGPADQQYTLDGRIERLPTDRTPIIHIRHDDIPGFVDKNGQIVGMRAMSMPFDIAPDVDLHLRGPLAREPQHPRHAPRPTHPNERPLIQLHENKRKPSTQP